MEPGREDRLPDFCQRCVNGLVHSHHGKTPNGLRLSGERSGAERDRCSRGFGQSLLMSRNMIGRYAWAEVLFNGPGLNQTESAEPEGPGASAVRSQPAPARTERKHDAGAGQTARGCLVDPSRLPRVTEPHASPASEASPVQAVVRRNSPVGQILVPRDGDSALPRATAT